METLKILPGDLCGFLCQYSGVLGWIVT